MFRMGGKCDLSDMKLPISWGFYAQQALGWCKKKKINREATLIVEMAYCNPSINVSCAFLLTTAVNSGVFELC